MGSVSVKLDVLVTARVPIPKGWAFRGEGPRLTQVLGVLRGGETLKSPCLAYVVKHPQAGVVLIDTGFHRDASESPRREFGMRLGLLFRGLRPEDLPYDEQLRECGVEPSDVGRVVMTHLHADHTSGMRLLPNARFSITRQEWSAATGTGSAGKGYAPHHLPPESRVDLVDFDRDGRPHGPFSATIDLLGDGSVRLLSTRGHTPGHMSVLLRVDGGEVLVVGDAVYTLRSLREEILPFLTWKDDRYLASLRELKAFADDKPDAVLVPSHDPDAWERAARIAKASTAAPQSTSSTM